MRPGALADRCGIDKHVAGQENRAQIGMVSLSFQLIADITRYKRTGCGKTGSGNLLRGPFQDPALPACFPVPDERKPFATPNVRHRKFSVFQQNSRGNRIG